MCKVSGDNRKIPDKHLSQRLLILLLLLGGQRPNSVFHFTVVRMIISITSIKHSKPSRKLNVFKYRAYSDPKLRVLEYVKEYIHQKNDRVDKEQILLKPYDTISYKQPLLPEEVIYNLSKTISYGLNRHSPEMDRGNICRN